METFILSLSYQLQYKTVSQIKQFNFKNQNEKFSNQGFNPFLPIQQPNGLFNRDHYHIYL